MNVQGMSQREAIERLWQMGKIWYKLDSTQKDLYNLFHDSVSKTVVWSCSRRLGKSRTVLVIAIEQCLQHPNSIVKYIAPQQKMVKTITRPMMREILEDCPKNLRPKFFTQDNAWRFPNGSEIQLAGTDSGNADNLRGGNAHLCIVDEAGMCQDLDYVVKSILLPTMTTTNGKILLVSTPPLSPDHDFVEYMNEAKLRGSFMEKTIDDNPRLTKEQKDAYIEELGGRDSIAVRREYYVEIITDSQRAVVPEFTKELQLEIIRECIKPAYYDSYASMDIGGSDLTAVLFAYLDFRNGKLIIEDEYSINGPDMTTDKVAIAIKEKENLHWKDPINGKTLPPMLRIADNNNIIMLNDLHLLHNLVFIPTAKDDKEAALNNMRILLAGKRIIINPRCKQLIAHLQNATWNKQRKSFERKVDEIGRQHHYDFVDALLYLVRNVVWTKNPFPLGFDMPKGDLYVNKEMIKDLNPFEQTVKNMYTPRSSLFKRRY